MIMGLIRVIFCNKVFLNLTGDLVQLNFKPVAGELTASRLRTREFYILFYKLLPLERVINHRQRNRLCSRLRRSRRCIVFWSRRHIRKVGLNVSGVNLNGFFLGLLAVVVVLGLLHLREHSVHLLHFVNAFLVRSRHLNFLLSSLRLPPTRSTWWLCPLFRYVINCG